MFIATVAGNLGKDAVHRTTQNGTDLCSFSVAADVGFGDSKTTIWVDVTKWGKGSQRLAEILRKGSKVTCIGEVSTREHEGKTYLQLNASAIKIQDAPKGERTPDGSQGSPPDNGYDDLDDEVPFLTSESLW